MGLARATRLRTKIDDDGRAGDRKAVNDNIASGLAMITVHSLHFSFTRALLAQRSLCERSEVVAQSKHSSTRASVAQRSLRSGSGISANRKPSSTRASVGQYLLAERSHVSTSIASCL